MAQQPLAIDWGFYSSKNANDFFTTKNMMRHYYDFLYLNNKFFNGLQVILFEYPVCVFAWLKRFNKNQVGWHSSVICMIKMTC